MTVNGSTKMASAIHCSEGKIGVETMNTVPNGFPMDFADYPFTKDKANFEDHLQKVKELEPETAVVPDIEKGQTLARAIEQGDRLLEYSDNVIMVPKTVHPSRIPDRFVVGYPNQPKFGSSSEFDVVDFRKEEVGQVHLLGGSPLKAIQAAQFLGNVVSYDTTSINKAGEKRSYYHAGSWVNDNGHMSVYECVIRSLNNIKADMLAIRQGVKQTSLKSSADFIDKDAKE